jgi:DNA-binding beta-propeller fold protein YncE
MTPTRFDMSAVLATAMALVLGIGPALAADHGSALPTSAMLSPVAAPGAVLTNLTVTLPDGQAILAGWPSAIQTSPDGKKLYALTSGFNRRAGADGKLDPAGSSEWLFGFDISGNVPVQFAVQPVPNAFGGLKLSADGTHAYVTGGSSDNVHVFSLAGNKITPEGDPIALGHKAGLGIDMKPEAGALAVSPDGGQALVANYFNDSVSLVDLIGHKVKAELDLRPGKINAADKGVAGGEYPVDVVWTAPGRGFVLSARDRELIALSIGPLSLVITDRIALPGQPTRMVVDAARNKIYVALDTTDMIVAVNQMPLKISAQMPIKLPVANIEAKGRLGTGLNNLLLDKSGNRLWASLAGLNAIAAVQIADDDGDDDEIGIIDGMVPVGWYPTALAQSADGHLIISHAKSLPGPNPGACRSSLDANGEGNATCTAHNQYVLQLEHGGLVSMPVPNASEMKRLSLKVAANNNLIPPKDHAANAALMRALSARIKHVVFIVKENRTYDQVLGDLPGAEGDPKLALLAPFSPNHHAIAQSFVTLDHAYCSGEVSNTGWTWTTAGRTTDALEHMSPVNYASRGLDYSAEGMVRNLNIGLGTTDARRKVNPNTPDDPDLLPGIADVSAPDARLGEAGTGFLWQSILRAGLTVRNYGFFVDDQIYVRNKPGYLVSSHTPYADKLVQSVVTRPELVDITDPYFRSFDQSIPDYWRYLEWAREFGDYEAKGQLPNLMMVRLSHDHFGSFKEAEDGVNTIETEMADNDYAVGLVVERIAHSRFKDDTLILSIEDDAQNGADHVNARRTVVLAAGPYVKQKVVVSKDYTTVNLLKTITDILRAEPIGLQSALAEPMAAIFDLKQKNWDYKAIVPSVLRKTQLPLPADTQTRAGAECPLRDSAYWAEAMKGQDFSSADKLDSARFNQALEQGLKPVLQDKACANLARR